MAFFAEAATCAEERAVLSCTSGRNLAFFTKTTTCARRESCTCPAPLAGIWPSLLKLLPVPEERAVLVLRLWLEAGLLCWNCYLCQKRDLYLSCASGHESGLLCWNFYLCQRGKLYLSSASSRNLAFFAETATCARRESCTCPAPLAGSWLSSPRWRPRLPRYLDP